MLVNSRSCGADRQVAEVVGLHRAHAVGVNRIEMSGFIKHAVDAAIGRRRTGDGACQALQRAFGEFSGV